MSTLPVPRPLTLPAVVLEIAEDAAALYARGSRAAATWRAYESDWRIFAAWCQSVEQPALPASPHTVALFLAAQARLGHAPNTLDRRRAAIRLMHVGAKVASPHDALEVDEVLRGIRRAWKQPPRQKAPAIDAEVQRLADAVEPQTRHGRRATPLGARGTRCGTPRAPTGRPDAEDRELQDRPGG
jgi:hypothetical protein